MWSDYNVHKHARKCAATDRPFAPGEAFFSVLAPTPEDPDGEIIERRDYCREAWQGPPENAVGWWRSKMPDGVAKPRLAPNEVMLELFHRWADEPQRVEARYVLTLLLLRRKVVRHATEDVVEADAALLLVFGVAPKAELGEERLDVVPEPLLERDGQRVRRGAGV